MFLRREETARRIVHTAWPVVLVNRSSGSVVRLPSVAIVVDMTGSLLVGGRAMPGWCCGAGFFGGLALFVAPARRGVSYRRCWVSHVQGRRRRSRSDAELAERP